MKLITDLKEKVYKIVIAIPYFIAVAAVLILLYTFYRCLPEGDKFLSLIFGSGLTGAAAILGIFYKQASKEKAQIENAPTEGLSRIKNESPPTKEQIEEEFLKLDTGDFYDITDQVDRNHRENCVAILSYEKNPLLQLRQELVNDDFNEVWIPKVPADMGVREKKQYWKMTPVYKNIVLPFSYFFILMDGFRYWIPLPKVEYNKAGEFEIDRNNPVKKCTITKVQYNLGKVLTNDHGYNTSYDEMLKQCKIEVIR